MKNCSIRCVEAMGKYQLSPQGTYSGRLDATQKYSGGRVSSQDCRNQVKDAVNQSDSPKKNRHYGVVEGEGVQDGGMQPPRFKPSPRRHSTACCDELSERREVEKPRLRMQRANVVVPLQNSNSAGHSFRSEDSESLALWEEKEQPASRSSRWMKITTQSPRWFDAMRKFDTLKLASWRSSPGQPKFSLDNSQRSLHRKISNRSLHELSKLPWYRNTSKKTRNGESRSTPSPIAASTLSRLCGELNPSTGPSSTWADETKDDCERGNFSRLRYTQHVTTEDVQISCVVARDLAPKVKPVLDRPYLVNGVVWESPEGGSKTGIESVTDALSFLTLGELEAMNDAQSAATDDASSEADMPTLYEEHTSPADKNASTWPGDTAPAIIVGAPAVFKLLGVEEEGELALEFVKSEDTAFFKREETLGSLGGGEMTGDVDETQFMALDPLSRLSDFSPTSPSGRLESPMTPDQMLSRLGSTASKSSHSFLFGKKSDNGECCDLSSPRSILCGPDRDSLPSSNPSLRSDPGIVSLSALAAAESQRNSSTGVSFDLNEHNFEEMHTAYDLNATAPCKPVESRRVSLSFRDFGPPRPSSEIAAAKVDPKAVGAATSTVTNMKLLKCDDQPYKNEPWSSPKPFQSPELWLKTVSPKYYGDELPQTTPETCISSRRVCPHSAPPLSRLSHAIPLEAEQLQQMPIVVPRARSRHSEFTARFGRVFSPLRLPANSRSCFEAQVLSLPHDFEVMSPTNAAVVELLSPSAPQSSTKLKRFKSSRRRYSSEDTPTVMVSTTVPPHSQLLLVMVIPHCELRSLVHFNWSLLNCFFKFYVGFAFRHP